MNDRDRENLAELIERLFHGEQAGGVLEDIRQGEQILRENPTPEPDRQLIADIKAKIAVHLPIRRAQLAKHRLYRKAAVAAAIVIIATISTILFDSSRPKSAGSTQFAGLIPTAIWESNDIAADDENLAVFTAQIEQIENEITNLESGNDAIDSTESIEEMEIELIVVSNDFWKE